MNEPSQRTVLRRIVSRQLDGFFAVWLAQLAAGSVALWERVERRLAERRKDEAAAPVSRAPMQEQPMPQPAQQQQQRKQDE